MAKPPKIRGIFEQERVTEQLLDFGVSGNRIDEVVGGLADTICRNPEIFAREPHTGWSRIIVKAFPPDIPFLRIWFTYNEDDVFIEYIEALDDLGPRE
jgi:hypothetical protein